jgi:hypothetical protein
MGDSRIRNIFEFFENLIKGQKVSKSKPHYNIHNVYENISFKMDFIWEPQTDFGNQCVFIRFPIFLGQILFDDA